MWRVPFSLLVSGYDDILSVQLTWNKTLSIGQESRAGRYVRGGRKVSDFTCLSEIRCFYPNLFSILNTYIKYQTVLDTLLQVFKS